MEMYNEYGIVSWGYLFDYLDKSAHNVVRQYLWNALTVSANIQYFSKLENMDNVVVDTQILWQTGKTMSVLLTLKVGDKIMVAWSYTFAKI